MPLISFRLSSKPKAARSHMPQFEYKVVPAPKRANKARGIRGQDARFSQTLEEILNDMATDGWEYIRADSMTVESGGMLRGSKSQQKTMLIFRRTSPLAESQPLVSEVHYTAPEPEAGPSLRATSDRPEPRMNSPRASRDDG